MNRLLESGKENLAQNAFRHIHGRAVRSGLGLAVRGKMFERGNNTFFVFKGGVTLKSLHRSNRHAGHQIGIFAIGLLNAAPARLASNIHDRRQGLVSAADASFLGGHFEKLSNELGIKRGAEPDRLGETCRVHGSVPMKAFLVKNHRDSQTAASYKESLNGIRQFSHLPGVPAASGIAGPPYLAEAKALPETILRFLKIEISPIVNEGFAFLFPDAKHLSRLFFQGHARKQVLRAFFGGKGWIQISLFSLVLRFGFRFHGYLLYGNAETAADSAACGRDARAPGAIP